MGIERIAIDGLAQSNMELHERVGELERLCRDMWDNCLVCKQNECAVPYWDEGGTHEQVGDYEACTIGRRMERLGLLEGDE